MYLHIVIIMIIISVYSYSVSVWPYQQWSSLAAMIALAWNPVQMSQEVKKGYEWHHKNEPKSLILFKFN